MVRIAQQTNFNGAKPSILPRHVLPVPQRMLRIDTHEHNVAVAVTELVETVLESQDFGWADKRECRGDEEKDKPLWRGRFRVNIGR